MTVDSQPQLFSDPVPPEARVDFSAMDQDTYSQAVAAAAPQNPHVTEDNRRLLYAGLTPERADLTHGHLVSSEGGEPVDELAIPDPVTAVSRAIIAEYRRGQKVFGLSQSEDRFAHRRAQIDQDQGSK